MPLGASPGLPQEEELAKRFLETGLETETEESESCQYAERTQDLHHLSSMEQNFLVVDRSEVEDLRVRRQVN